ncbi:MAG: hypothetical protein ABFD83_00580 [Armatimonadota bacterium]
MTTQAQISNRLEYITMAARRAVYQDVSRFPTIPPVVINQTFEEGKPSCARRGSSS